MACSLLKFLLHLSFNECGKGLVLELFYTYFGLYSIISGIESFPSNISLVLHRFVHVFLLR